MGLLMAEYVVFTLTAPMGSFGGPAGHERRSSGAWPGRSALLGLIGAALGVRRDDKVGQEALGVWRTAVAVLAEGALLQDFHTVQSVPSTTIKRPSTRADALRALKQSDNTSITRRDYRTDCAFSVVLWGGIDAQSVADALNRPVFTPYLGRKSCPLAAPMAAKTVQAEDATAALTLAKLPPWLTGSRPLRIISDVPLAEGREETLWDDPIDRDLWHFAPRKMYIGGGDA
jgi:CRISPR system Cascade subunit CasD